MTKVKVLSALAVPVAAAGLFLALTSPPDALQRTYARIVHIHAPSAWLAFLAFGITALGSILWRFNRRTVWDRVAAASAEIGVVFTGLALITGAIWGRPVWGVFFDWRDPRMASTAVMFLVYLGYLALRRFAPSPEIGASRSSILGIVAVLQVPLVYFSVNLFRTLHPTQSIRPDGATMPGAMVVALLVNLAAFTLIYLALLAARYELLKAEAARAVPEPVAGSVVIAPPGLTDV